MTLVKDLEGHRIVYYWINESGEKVSPELPTLPIAEEWYVQYHHSLYSGPERRRSHIDRRRLYKKRDNLDRATNVPTDPIGRRITDKHVKVGIDLSKQKMLELAEIMKNMKDDND